MDHFIVSKALLRQNKAWLCLGNESIYIMVSYHLSSAVLIGFLVATGLLYCLFDLARYFIKGHKAFSHSVELVTRKLWIYFSNPFTLFEGNGY